MGSGKQAVSLVRIVRAEERCELGGSFLLIHAHFTSTDAVLTGRTFGGGGGEAGPLNHGMAGRGDHGRGECHSTPHPRPLSQMERGVGTGTRGGAWLRDSRIRGNDVGSGAA